MRPVRLLPGLYLAAALATVLCGAGGCRPRPEAQVPQVCSSAERGPIRLTVCARPAQVWLGDPVEVVVTAEAPDEYELKLPEAESLSPLEVGHVETVPPRPVEHGRQWQRRFVLITHSSGTLKIPALAIRYAKRVGSDAAPPLPESELGVEELSVEVRSALTSQDSVSRPRDITSTLAVPPNLAERVSRILLPVAAAVAGLALAAFVWRRRRQRGATVAVLAPEIRALRALAALESRDWVGAGQAREFYYQLSEIVRRYIEEKFGLAAPEMTTEEFLNVLARDRTALPYDSYRLRQFLEACDIVKYAAFVPQRADAEQALAAARAFIHQTAAAAAQPREQAA